MSGRLGLSAGGRRLQGRLPNGLVGMGIVLLVVQVISVIVWSDQSERPDRRPQAAAPTGDGKVEITYIVTGDRPSADVEYNTPNGSEDHENTLLPFRTTYRFKRGESMSLRVQNRYQNGAGNMMCTILADGAVVKQATASGSYAIATCDGEAGSDKPLPGATVPATTASPGSGLPKGEVRLTKVVPVKRYTGDGSPVTGSVTDDDAHLSYAELGGSWNASRRTDPMIDGFDRQQYFDTEAKWQAKIASGSVDSDLMDAYTGTDRLRKLSSAVQGDRQKYAYTDTTIGRDIASEPIKVSGRPAWVIVREMHFHQDKVKATMDLSVVVVVDTGRPRPSLLWISLPETHKRLWPDINTMIRSLRTT